MTKKRKTQSDFVATLLYDLHVKRAIETKNLSLSHPHPEEARAPRKNPS